MFPKLNILVCTFLVVISSAFPSLNSPIDHRGLDPSSTPLPPSQDPWYTAPPDFESKLPGTILRLRHAPGNLTSITANCSATYNILYRTTDSLYKPTWAVTTLYIPSKPLLSTTHLGNALLSYQWPYNTVNLDNSPSYTSYSFPLSNLSTSLGLGWFVSVPDFEGPLAANVAGILEGHAVLDSLRAILSIFSTFGLSPDTRIALWGYSGGSIASEWALELQEQYAPELQISGAALGGLVPNVTAAFENVQGTSFAYIAASGIMGVTRQYPDAYNFLLSQLKTSGPFNKTGFLAVEELGPTQGFIYFAGQNIWGYFIDGSEILQATEIKKVWEENLIMTYHGVPRVPLFVYKAIGDEVTFVGDTDAYVERNCGLGAEILYQRNSVGGHLDEFTNGVPRAVEWLGRVFDGEFEGLNGTAGCTVQNVTVGPVDTGF